MVCAIFEGVFLVLELSNKWISQTLTIAALSLRKLCRMGLQLLPNCILWVSILFVLYVSWKTEVAEVVFFFSSFIEKTSDS